MMFRKLFSTSAIASMLFAMPLAAQAQDASPAAPCGGDFAAWKSDMYAEAERAGVGPTGLAAMETAGLDERVLKRDRSQGVFTQTFVQFAGKLISDQRINTGKKKLQENAAIFARAEEKYGAPAAVITAFWALESDYGTFQGDFHTLSALLTLSHDCRRPELFRKQIVPLLTLIDRGVLPADVQGAWAGEIGQTQILPIDYLEHGIDGDNDGKVDLRTDVADVIMTSAAKLHDRGWKAGQPWLEEVRVPDNLPWEQTGRTTKIPLKQWAEWGVTKRDGSPLTGDYSAGLILPMGHKGPAFLGYDNFDVYIEWNQSATYALTAGYLATRFAGAPPLDPRNADVGLDNAQMKELQTKLEARGFNVGKVDGILGTNTREAVRQEQKRLGFVVDGWPTPALLAAI